MNLSENEEPSKEQETTSTSTSEKPKLNVRKAGRRKDCIWNYFEEKGVRNKGHCGAICSFCGWKQVTAQINEMKGHLALYCRKVSKDVKVFYLEEVKKTTVKSSAKKKLDQPKIFEKFESTRIDDSKTIMANRAVIKFFTCCGIPFHIVENPFFIDLLHTLCLGYFPLSRQTLSVDMLNSEMSYVVCETNDILNKETNLTLGSYY